MPTHLKRFYGHHDLHFITFSCYARKPLLAKAEHRDVLLQILEKMRQRYRFVVVGYVIMPEHVHLLISEPEEGTPSTVLQAIKLAFSRHVLTPGQGIIKGNDRSDLTRNRIWQRRFYDFNVWTDRKCIEKLRYMHRNPVKRGLVTKPEQWAWSSFRSYMYGESGIVRINDWQVLDKIHFFRVSARGIPRLAKNARHGAPGTRQFLSSIQDYRFEVSLRSYPINVSRSLRDVGVRVPKSRHTAHHPTLIPATGKPALFLHLSS